MGTNISIFRLCKNGAVKLVLSESYDNNERPFLSSLVLWSREHIASEAW
jgi:hypothetical protein